jgi:Spy/CpxP family protein refolding chaperone
MTQMVKRGLVAAGVAVMLAAAPLQARAQDLQGSMHGRRGFMGGGFAGLRQLDLTDDQRQQIRAAMASHRDEFKSIGDRVRKAREAQQAAIEQVPLNEPQIRAASSELAAAEADAAVLRARVHEQVFSLLTPEQQTKARSLAAERRQFRAQRRAEWQQRMEKFRQQQPNQAAPQQQ